MNNAFLLCGIVGFFLAAAPIICRLSSANGIMMALLIGIGNLIPMLPFAFSQNYAAAGARSLAIGVAGGIANGIGLLAFYRLVAGSNEGLWEISRVLPISLVLIPIGIAIGARVFFSEPITTNKIIGLALAAAAIWFLNR